MKIWSKIGVLAFALMMGGMAMAQTKVGYTNATVNRNDIVRFGTTEKQGMAVYIDAEKAALLKGTTLKKFLTYVSTTQCKNATFFITKELGGTADFQQSFVPTSSRSTMIEYQVSDSYVLDGEPFYFGHTLEAGTNYKPLSFDRSANTEAGISWAYENGEWIDVSAKGYGVPNIQIAVDGLSAFTDLMVRPVQAEGYQVAGKAQVFGGQVFNFGSTKITSFDITCKVGNAAPVVTSVSGISLESGKSYDFTLPEYTTSESGSLNLEVSVSNINGTTDAENTDNTALSQVFFYPEGVEKKILVEVFTGQTCGNCPTGHANLANAMRGIEDEFIEVAHHAGYYPDQFTMEESYSYTWLYATAGTFAPGAMFNRTVIPTISVTSPVFESTSNAYVKTAVQAFRQTQPYVGLKLYNKFDETTRKGTLVVDIETFVVPSESMHTLNVWLVQDGMMAMQASGGTNYVHNHVFRGSLNNNAWGQQILLNPGETERRTFEYEIPATIASTYGDYKGTAFDAIPKDMQIVAFVSDFSSTSPTSCNVYNAAKIAVLTDNLTGIEAVGIDKAPLFTFDGSQMHIVGDFIQADFYTTSGTLVASLDKNNSSFVLPTGFYVVRTQLPSGIMDVQKLLIK